MMHVVYSILLYNAPSGGACNSKASLDVVEHFVNNSRRRASRGKVRTHYDASID